jgi:hypothetical protein
MKFRLLLAISPLAVAAADMVRLNGCFELGIGPIKSGPSDGID